MTIWYKHIQQPWLDYLLAGPKIYEGRLVWKDWKLMQRDDIIVFTDDDKKSASFKILGFVYANNFAELYSRLGSQLVPGENLTPCENLTPDLVQSMYESLFGLNLEQIEKYGVMGIKLEII